MTDPATQKKRANEIKERFATFRDRLRVKSHLLGMDAKDAITDFETYMGKVEDRLGDFVQQVSEEAGDSKLQARLALMEARDRLQAVADELQHFTTETKAAASDAKTQFDYARVQAHLAKMDAEDRWKEKRDQWRAKLSGTSDDGTSHSREALDHMDDFMTRLYEEMPR